MRANLNLTIDCMLAGSVEKNGLHKYVQVLIIIMVERSLSFAEAYTSW